MKKEELTLQQKLLRRKYRIPNRLFYWAYHFIMSDLVMPKFHPTYLIKDDINDCQGPAFLIWNHLSRIDHAYLMQACYPRRFNMLAGYNEFFRSHLHTVFKMMNIIPKKNYTRDVPGIRAMNEIIKQGGVVCFSPEGMSSIYGTNQPIIVGTGHFLKHYGIPVYFLKLEGQYLENTKVCLDERYGRSKATMQILFTKDDLEKLTPEEIEAKINESFRHDDYEWNKTERIEFKNNGEICKRLDDICYKCPRCGAEIQMTAKKDFIKCNNCGNGAHMNDYYDFVPFDDKCVIPVSPSKWVEWERGEIIKAIRRDPKYFYSEEVKLGYIPSNHWIPDKKTSELCGSGTFTIDHDGIHFKGTKLGQPWSFDMDYTQVFSLPIITDMSYFSLYVNEEYYDFFPMKPTVGKMLLLTEEMHRLHVNTWKNFSWLDYLYSEKQEENKNGITDKN